MTRRPQVTLRFLRPRPGAPLLVLGPSLGTAVETLWGDCLDDLAGSFEVAGWDLPGHGHSPAVTAPFTLGDLAASIAEELRRYRDGVPTAHAGVSVGGAVGLHLALQLPHLRQHSVICSGARIGEPDAWRQRAASVLADGTRALVPASAARWFAPAPASAPAVAARRSRLLAELEEVDDASYAAVCGALASHDLHGRLGEVVPPTLAVSGEHDAVVPVDALRTVADGVQRGRHVVLRGVAHLPPAEDPAATARCVAQAALGALGREAAASP